jgi:4-amino-4-deoxy-L-arabinose transferase-like glycosyltransferase
MADRSETWIAALALSAAGLVLCAPVLGRIGHAGAADAAMALAAACGLGSFLLAGRATLRAARSGSGAAREREDAR